MARQKTDYTVGYKKPPLHSRFQPGESGNPRGRPSGIQNLATDLEEELGQKVAVTEGGTKRETTKQRAMLKTLFAKALSGDTRAASVLIGLILGLEQARASAQATEQMDDEDLAILTAYRDRILSEGRGRASTPVEPPTSPRSAARPPRGGRRDED